MFDARKIALALAPFCAAAAVPAFAQAAPQDASYTVTRVPVSLADLDLGTVKGRTVADQRVRMAARSACAIGTERLTLGESRDAQACFRGALRQGKVQVALAREQVLASR